MKKIALFFVLAAMTLPGFAAQNEDRTFHLSDFNGIEVDHNFKTELTRSDKFSVSVSAPSEYMSYIHLKVEEGILKVSIGDVPRKLNSNRAKADFIVHVAMPELNSIKLSGAAQLHSDDCFMQPESEVKIECTGASKIEGLCFQAKDVDVEISGASKATMNLEAVKAELELSGAAKLTLFGKTMIGSLEMSGASGFKGKEFCFDSMELDQSGASRSEVWVLHNFEIDLTGSSHCEYLPEENIRLDVEGVSGASSLEKIK